MPTKQITGGAFQFCDGTPLAGGSLTLTLSQDAVVVGTGTVIRATPIRLTLDGSGNIPSTAVFFNDELSPAGTFYTAQVSDPSGAIVYAPTSWIFAGATGLNLNTLTPATGGVSYPSPVVTTPSADQSITAANLLPASGNSTQSLGSAAAQWLANLYSLSAGAFNQILIVDGARFTTVAAAVTAAGSNKTLIVIPQNYAGAEYNSTTINGVTQSIAPSNVTILDLRGGTTGHDIDINSNAQDTLNHIQTKLSVRNTNTAIASNFTSSAILGTNQITGVIPSGSVSGGTFETDVYGTITSNNNGIIQSVNGETAVSSQGGTIALVTGVEGGVRLKDNGASPSTTNITTAVSISGDLITNTSTGGATITDAFGGRFAAQTAGTRNNMAAAFEGDVMIADNKSLFVENGSSAALKIASFGIDNVGTAGLSLFDPSGGSFGTSLKLRADGGHFNWLVGAQVNVSNTFEITPSTATNGTTFTTPIFTASTTGVATSGSLSISGATPTGSGSTLGLGNTTGFGNGTAGQAVTTTLLGTGSGPATPQTIKKYLEIDLGGTKYWVPLVQ